VVAHEVDRGDELRKAFQGVVLALDWDHHGVRRGEGVDRQEAERRRAIQKDVVVGGYQLGKYPGQAPFALGEGGQFHFSSRE
jgi:hypothetical protein